MPAAFLVPRGIDGARAWLQSEVWSHGGRHTFGQVRLSMGFLVREHRGVPRTPRARLVAAVAVSGCLAVAPLGACSSAARQEALSIFFDGVVQPTPPPTRRTRRDLLREIEELKRQLAEARTGAAASKEVTAPESVLPVERAKSWSEAAELLPQDRYGNVNWAEALRAGTIKPQPGVDPETVEQPVLPIEVLRVPAAGEMFKVVFPHEPHTALLACPSCHPALFQMQAGATPMSMAGINAGTLCGVCHGKVAFPTTACGRCHPAMRGG